MSGDSATWMNKALSGRCWLPVGVETKKLSPIHGVQSEASRDRDNIGGVSDSGDADESTDQQVTIRLPEK